MKDRGDKLPGLASIVEMDDDIENLLVSTDPDTSGAMPQPLPRDKVLDIIDDVWPITDKARGICDQSGRTLRYYTFEHRPAPTRQGVMGAAPVSATEVLDFMVRLMPVVGLASSLPPSSS